MPRPNLVEKKEFLRIHLPYVINQARAIATFYETGGDKLLSDYLHKSVVHNALLESSLSFLRKINEFFGEGETRDKDICVSDYLGPGWKRYLFSEKDSAELNDWVMHLSLKETREGKRDWNDFYTRLLTEARKRYDAFTDAVRREHPEYLE